MRHVDPEETWFGLHEVYYDESGKPTAMTERPVDFVCAEEEGPEGIVRALELALKDARTRAVLDASKIVSDGEE